VPILERVFEACDIIAPMARRRIHVTAIHNRTRPRAEVYYPKDDDSVIAIPPDQTITGSWFIVFDPFEHPDLDSVPAETELWFVNSATEFRWGSHTFADGPIHLSAYLRLYDEFV
jgi:hypothetical protein